MTGAAWGATVARILAALETLGPQTRAELCTELGDTRGYLSRVLSRLHDTERVHVIGWVDDLGDGSKRYPRPIYAAGPGKDKPRPPRERLAVRRRYEAKLKAQSITSVFDLGLTRAERRARQAANNDQAAEAA